MADRMYDVVITERIITHYRVAAANRTDAAFKVGADKEQAEQVSRRVAGTKVESAPTLAEDASILQGRLDDATDPANGSEIADDLLAQLEEAQAANSGETEVGTPPQKRAAR